MDPILDHFFTALGVFICAVGLLGNVSVLLAFFSHRKLQTNINCFLVSLAFADLALTSISVPLEMEWHIRSEFIHSAAVCDMMYTIHFATLSSSSLNLLAVAIYRYFTIAFPFFTKFVTRMKVLMALLVLWLYSTITALLPVLGWRSIPTITTGNFCGYSFENEFVIFVLTANWLCPAVLVFVVYGLIYRIARIQAIKIRRHQVLGEHERRRRLLFKGTKTLAKIAVVYLVCWFPYVINVLLFLFGAYVSPKEMNYTFALLCYGSAAINPFLYAGLCADFREVFSKFLSQALIAFSSARMCIASLPRRMVLLIFLKSSALRMRHDDVTSSPHLRSSSGSSLHQPSTVATLV